MKLRVLIDNHSLGLPGEWGLSFLIEAEGRRILFDVGRSDLFMRNAHHLDVDLANLDWVVISHGHYDHTWGLPHLIRSYMETNTPVEERPTVVSHPDAFRQRFNSKGKESGSLISAHELARHFELTLSREPVWLTDRLAYLGEIQRRNDFEARKPLGKILIDGQPADDFLLDDTGLAYRTPEGLVVIVGCSHSGICNIVEQAKRVCQDDRVVDIVGGFHLQKPPRQQLAATVEYLTALKPRALHPCHCTDLASKIALSKAGAIGEVGVGLTLEY